MLIEQAKEVLQIEAQSILGLMDRIGPAFEEAVSLILEAGGKGDSHRHGKIGSRGQKDFRDPQQYGHKIVFFSILLKPSMGISAWPHPTTFFLPSATAGIPLKSIKYSPY